MFCGGCRRDGHGHFSNRSAMTDFLYICSRNTTPASDFPYSQVGIFPSRISSPSTATNFLCVSVQQRFPVFTAVTVPRDRPALSASWFTFSPARAIAVMSFTLSICISFHHPLCAGRHYLWHPVWLPASPGAGISVHRPTSFFRGIDWNTWSLLQRSLCENTPPSRSNSVPLMERGKLRALATPFLPAFLR